MTSVLQSGNHLVVTKYVEVEMGQFRFNNTYAHLPERFYERIAQPHFAGNSRPVVVAFNQSLGDELLISRQDQSCAHTLGASEFPPGSNPVAMSYAGHQFGHFVPQLGDGRALLLGEIIGRSGRRFDLHLKGAGPTRYSRGGDGFCPLRAALREYLVSEALAALNVPTTRSLAVTLTGQTIQRERRQPGAVLARIATSHLRIGTFEYFAARADRQALQILADYSIARHYPDIHEREAPAKYRAFLQKVIRAQSQLIAKWMSYGFVHGVMNTDNMTISGETIDYGPCAFIDDFAFHKTFSSIDQCGRYAYQNQLLIAQWNLSVLANGLSLLVTDNKSDASSWIEETLDFMPEQMQNDWLTAMGRKLGLLHSKKGDQELILQFLNFLQDYELDFTLSFRALSSYLQVLPNEGAANAPSGISYNPLLNLAERARASFERFLVAWRSRLQKDASATAVISETMLSVNPCYIPRNHLVDLALRHAEDGDYTLFNGLSAVLADPFWERPQFGNYALPPGPGESITTTFCGT